MKILNYGSLNYDYVYTVEHIMLPGETQSSKGMKTFCGGKGLNQSVALARAGVSVVHAGMVGEEGEALLNLCKDNGVDTTYIKKIQGKSGHTIIQVDKNAQNCILLYGGANRMQTREHMDMVLEAFAEGDVLLLQNEINELEYLIERAFEKGMFIVLNPSPMDEALKACDMSKIKLFLMNEVEGGQITGCEAAEEILCQIKERYPCAKVVLTLGEKGAVYQEQERIYKQECIAVKAVDTTAAGDTFTGYFIAGMVKGLSPEQIMKRSATAAALAVTKPGAVNSIPFREEVEQFLKELK